MENTLWQFNIFKLYVRNQKEKNVTNLLKMALEVLRSQRMLKMKKTELKFLLKTLHSRNKKTQKSCEMLKYVLEVADVKSFFKCFQ